ncbi:uncharacterized protein BDZ99DRAFT_499075 [Mytilinidion resinicola]|uniref:Zn(2)-C6 fungal-type domain-containing protein n=1 Tax=Mytilinidion resinicola TaxID=574789 RepID=A0A6A6YP90_9PEZI|nr:uncharacterized protein BDZ99DRAFT_499075 [Mytilinidion resinicola]KAF2809795.1 hypothetical protein BDZ99DRAFT_499075 [Mytilinidion resinicola]
MNRPSRRRVCNRCGELKVRCTLLEGSDTCERCARLGHQCVFVKPARAQAPSRRKDRLDQLQDQVNSLAAELALRRREEKAAESPVSATSIAEQRYQSRGQHLLDSTPNQSPRPTPIAEPQTAIAQTHDVFSRGFLTISAGDRLIAKFQKVKMPLFPFVIIPPDTTVFSLRLEYPFLLLAILTASTEDDLPLQRKLETEFRTTICNRLVMTDERSMDLLLGLLVHIAWHHYHFETVRRQLYMITQMAISIVVDLGLDRDHNFGLRDIAAEVQGHLQEDTDAEARHHTSAEKRALLGCYYLYSVSSLFRKQLYMRHTDWIGRCCEDLATRPEYPSDVYLKTFIDIQLLSRGTEDIITCQDILHQVNASFEWHRQLSDVKELGREILARHSQDDPNIPQSLLRDLQAIPIYINKSFLHHNIPIMSLHHPESSLPRDSIIKDLFSGSKNCISTMCELPNDVVMHLPQTSHTMLWYSLLVATKTALSSSNSGAGSREVKPVYDLAVAASNLHKRLSIGDDVWAISQRAIGFVLSWLERYEAQGLRRQPPKEGSTHPKPDGGIPRVANPANNGHSLPMPAWGALDAPTNQSETLFNGPGWDEVMQNMMIEDFFPWDISAQLPWPQNNGGPGVW